MFYIITMNIESHYEDFVAGITKKNGLGQFKKTKAGV